LTKLTARQPTVDFVESSCGAEESVDNRVLIAYASRCGSTGEIADAIGQVFCTAGAAVDVRLVKDVSDPRPYRAVVVGSAIRQGRLLPEVVEFVETHRDALGKVPVAAFVACLTMTGDTEENRQKAAAYLDPLRGLMQLVSEGLFAGTLDFGQISLPEQLILRAMGSSEGDFRDWDAVQGWADGLSSVLLNV
jgi:menaquinone-dependent protoporphyrinogen oxidase